MQRSLPAGLVIWLAMSGAAGEEMLIIAPRVAAPAPAPKPADDLTTNVRTLGGDEALQKERYESLRVVARSINRVGDQLVERLDGARFDDWIVRRGALRGIQALGVTGPRVSSAIAWVAVRDSEPKVRAEAVSIIKARGDRSAAGLIARHLVDAFDRQGAVTKEQVHDNAVHALRAIGDRRAAETLVAYAFLEIRAGIAQNIGLGTRHMRSPVGTSGGGASTVDLPIELPSISVTEYQGTIVVPALAALRSLTGQDLGKKREQWARWIRSHPVADWR